MGKPEGKRPLERARRKWEDNNKMDLREMGCDAGDWIDIFQESLCNQINRVRILFNTSVGSHSFAFHDSNHFLLHVHYVKQQYFYTVLFICF